MMRKIFGVKNITHLLYGLILLLPFGMVFGRTIYTIANKNAKDSYKENIVETKTQVVDYSKVHLNYYYIFDNTINVLGVVTKVNMNLIDAYTENSAYQAQIDNLLNHKELFTYFAIYQSGNNYGLGYYSSDSNIQASIFFGNPSSVYFTFEYLGNTGTLSNIFPNLQQIEYKNTNTLDNAFEYSLSQFTENNNLGNVNFFSWFTNLFLDQTNAHNLVYLNFANWYMNYALLVSSGYLLFLCLLWFTNYVRRILDKSMNHDFGGF